MPEISRQQKQYLARQKKEKHITLAARTLLFVVYRDWETVFPSHDKNSDSFYFEEI